MHIDKFAEITKAEVDKFVADWKANHARGSEKLADNTTYRKAYPLTMGEGEWFEHLVMALTTGQGP